MTLASGFAWLWRAEELATTGDLRAHEWEAVATSIRDDAIDPGTYSAFVSGD